MTEPTSSTPLKPGSPAPQAQPIKPAPEVSPEVAKIQKAKARISELKQNKSFSDRWESFKSNWFRVGEASHTKMDKAKIEYGQKILAAYQNAITPAENQNAITPAEKNSIQSHFKHLMQLKGHRFQQALIEEELSKDPLLRQMVGLFNSILEKSATNQGLLSSKMTFKDILILKSILIENDGQLISITSLIEKFNEKEIKEHRIPTLNELANPARIRVKKAKDKADFWRDGRSDENLNPIRLYFVKHYEDQFKKEEVIINKLKNNSKLELKSDSTLNETIVQFEQLLGRKLRLAELMEAQSYFNQKPKVNNKGIAYEAMIKANSVRNDWIILKPDEFFNKYRGKEELVIRLFLNQIRDSEIAEEREKLIEFLIKYIHTLSNKLNEWGRLNEIKKFSDLIKNSTLTTEEQKRIKF